MGRDVCGAQCWVVEGDLQSVLELLDVCPAVCVADHAGEMFDGVGVVVCSVVGGIGGVLSYPVRGLMGLGYGGYVLGLCVVSAEVRDLEGRQVCCALVYCLVVDLTISVLVPVGPLFHDAELDVARRGGFVEWLPCFAEEHSCVDSGVYQTRRMCRRWAGRWAAISAMASAMAPSSPWEAAP